MLIHRNTKVCQEVLSRVCFMTSFITKSVQKKVVGFTFILVEDLMTQPLLKKCSFQQSLLTSTHTPVLLLNILWSKEEKLCVHFLSTCG